MAITNKQKRAYTCQFCPRRHGNCQCKKFWKEIYKAHRNEIIEMYHIDFPEVNHPDPPKTT